MCLGDHELHATWTGVTWQVSDPCSQLHHRKLGRLGISNDATQRNVSNGLAVDDDVRAEHALSVVVMRHVDFEILGEGERRSNDPPDTAVEYEVDVERGSR